MTDDFFFEKFSFKNDVYECNTQKHGENMGQNNVRCHEARALPIPKFILLVKDFCTCRSCMVRSRQNVLNPQRNEHQLETTE